MKRVRSVLLIIGLGTTLAAARAAPQNPDPLKWVWHCGSPGFYNVKVSPDGQYQPGAQKGFGGPLTISIRRDITKTYEWCSGDRLGGSEDYVEITQEGSGGSLFSVRGDPCVQLFNYKFSTSTVDKEFHQQLESVRVAIIDPKFFSLYLMRDDFGWKFVLSASDLTTERRARDLRAYTPAGPAGAPPIQWKAEAEVYFITGECLLSDEPQH